MRCGGVLRGAKEDPRGKGRLRGRMDRRQGGKGEEQRQS